MDIDRFKTDKISEYFEHIVALHDKWRFPKIRTEVNVAQDVIVNDLEDYIKRNGIKLVINKYRPNRHQGTKEERISSTLDHKYEQGAIYFPFGGYTAMLEEELVLNNPPHDDLKDALAAAVDVIVKPFTGRDRQQTRQKIIYGRFGGVQSIVET